MYDMTQMACVNTIHTTQLKVTAVTT